MKKELAKKWVDALRSGNYKQGKTKLCNWDGEEYSFCCLGVLLDISDEFDRGELEEFVSEEFVSEDRTFLSHMIDREALDYPEHHQYVIEDEELIEPVRDYFGISKSIHDKLIQMNDDENEDFHQIAKYIEDKYIS